MTFGELEYCISITLYPLKDWPPSTGEDGITSLVYFKSKDTPCLMQDSKKNHQESILIRVLYWTPTAELNIYDIYSKEK